MTRAVAPEFLYNAGAIVVACKRFVQFRSALSGKIAKCHCPPLDGRPPWRPLTSPPATSTRCSPLPRARTARPPIPTSAPAGHPPDDPSRAVPRAFTRGGVCREAVRLPVGPHCDRVAGRVSAETQRIRDRTASTAGRFTRHRPPGQPGSSPDARPSVRIGVCRSGFNERNTGGERTPRTTGKPAIPEEDPPWPDTMHVINVNDVEPKEISVADKFTTS